MTVKVINIQSFPYKDQYFGTSGIRKKVSIFTQQHYLNNILASIFNVCGIKNKIIILGGDGRYFNKEAILIAIKMLIAYKAKKIFIGKNGWFSTPAVSHFIQKYNLHYGIIFSASHNPAGIDGDFGIKLNGNNGSPINQELGEKIYNYTKSITNYYITENFNFDINKIQSTEILGTKLEVIDSVKDYSNLMEKIFDFDKISSLFKSGFTMKYDAYNAVTGIYAKDIFHNKLKVPLDDLINIEPLEDFGKKHANPNSLYAKHLIDLSKNKESPDILCASDGDGDRNIIIGKGIMVPPSDSLAIIVLYAKLIKFYQNNILGVARSMPTSKAVDKVASYLNIQAYEVPTGWRFFGSLLENKMITFCGEESYGTGSNHSGEKDGIWAILFWLNIIASLKKSIKEILLNFWEIFGRYYFTRLDYYNISTLKKEEIFDNFLQINNKHFNINNISNKDIIPRIFNYKDDITNKIFNNKELIADIKKDMRIVLRASGTNTSSVALRVYIEKLETNPKFIQKDTLAYLHDLIKIVNKYICTGLTPALID